MADNTIFDVPNEVALDLTGKTIMVHDLAQPEATSTVLVTFENLKSEVQKETQNGLVITGGNTELGGDIIHPTTINVNNFQTVFQKGGLSAMGFVPSGSLSEQWLLITGSSDFRIATANTFKDSTIGNESIGCAINIKDLSGGGKQKGFSNKYYVSTNDMQSYWHYNNSVTNESLYMGLSEINGFEISPYDAGVANPFAGNFIFSVNNVSGNSVFRIKPSGIINEVLPPYADDADAGANGLVAGDRYQTSGAGASPLNVAGMVLVKQ